MRRRSLHAALIANALLLAALGARALSPSADAQNAGVQARGRGEYTLVAGKLPSGGPHAIYVLDSANQELIALRWDASRQTLSAIGFRNTASDAAARAGR